MFISEDWTPETSDRIAIIATTLALTLSHNTPKRCYFANTPTSLQERRGRQQRGILAKLINLFTNRHGVSVDSQRPPVGIPFRRPTSQENVRSSPLLRTDTLRGVNSFFGTPRQNQYTIFPKNKYVSVLADEPYRLYVFFRILALASLQPQRYALFHSRVTSSSIGLTSTT